MEKTLDKLDMNKSAVVSGIENSPEVKERLGSIGIIPGCEITPLFTCPLGSPVIYLCLNTLIALRPDVTSKIKIQISK